MFSFQLSEKDKLLHLITDTNWTCLTINSRADCEQYYGPTPPTARAVCTTVAENMCHIISPPTANYNCPRPRTRLFLCVTGQLLENRLQYTPKLSPSSYWKMISPSLITENKQQKFIVLSPVGYAFISHGLRPAVIYNRHKYGDHVTYNQHKHNAHANSS